MSWTQWIRHVDKDYPQSVKVFVSRREALIFWVCRWRGVYEVTRWHFISPTAEGQAAELWSAIHGGPMKRKDTGALNGGAAHARADDLAKRWPNLIEFLTAARWEGEEGTRESPTLTIWAAGGIWRCSIRDRAEGLVLWLSDEKLQDLVGLANDFVLDPQAPWRVDDAGKQENGKRVKHRT